LDKTHYHGGVGDTTFARHYVKEFAGIVQLTSFDIPTNHNVTGDRIQRGTCLKQNLGITNGTAFCVHVDQAVLNEGIGVKSEFQRERMELATLNGGGTTFECGNQCKLAFVVVLVKPRIAENANEVLWVLQIWRGFGGSGSGNGKPS